MVGILSGPKAFDDLTFLRTVLSSFCVNGSVLTLRRLEIFMLGRVISLGSLGSFPNRFLK